MITALRIGVWTWHDGYKNWNINITHFLLFRVSTAVGVISFFRRIEVNKYFPFFLVVNIIKSVVGWLLFGVSSLEWYRIDEWFLWILSGFFFAMFYTGKPISPSISRLGLRYYYLNENRIDQRKNIRWNWVFENSVPCQSFEMVIGLYLSLFESKCLMPQRNHLNNTKKSNDVHVHYAFHFKMISIIYHIEWHFS